MPFKVVCPNCQKALAAKEEMAGRTVRCPKCKKPLTVPAPKAAASQRPPARREAAPPQRQTAAASRPAAPAAGSTTSIWDDDLGAAASPAGTGPSSPCPGCGKSLGEDKVVCIDCGYNRKLGRKMVTQDSQAAAARRAARAKASRAAKQDNPFQSPLASSGKVGTVGSVVVASSNQRFFNSILDTIGIWVFAFLIGAVSAILGVSDQLLAIPGWGFGLFLIYYIGQEALWGKTFGKWITGTKVVNERGGPPSLGQIVGRTLCRFIPFDHFSFLGQQPIGWHDNLSSTRVVRER